MVKAVIDGQGFDWPCGTFVNSEELGFRQCMMAMETSLGNDGVSWQMPTGTTEELAALKLSYEHLVKLRDEVIDMGVLPPLEEWVEVNPNLALAEAVPA
jgi:malate dehydrogenase